MSLIKELSLFNANYANITNMFHLYNFTDCNIGFEDSKEVDFSTIFPSRLFNMPHVFIPNYGIKERLVNLKLPYRLKDGLPSDKEIKNSFCVTLLSQGFKMQLIECYMLAKGSNTDNAVFCLKFTDKYEYKFPYLSVNAALSNYKTYNYIAGSDPVLEVHNDKEQLLLSFNFVKPENKEKDIWDKEIIALKVFIDTTKPNEEWSKDIYMIFFDPLNWKEKMTQKVGKNEELDKIRKMIEGNIK